MNRLMGTSRLEESGTPIGDMEYYGGRPHGNKTPWQHLAVPKLGSAKPAMLVEFKYFTKRSRDPEL